MDISKYINEEDVRKTLEILKPDGELFECRVLGNDKKNILSGYFTNAETLLEAFNTIDIRKTNIYITLNKLNEAVYSREQHDKFIKNAQSTNDNEVTDYEWLFIDLDPTRPAGVSSSETEFTISHALADHVSVNLAKQFGYPVEAISGNGYHLLYKVDFKKTKESTETVKKLLEYLDEEFSNEFVKIDVANFNPSRICKLHGTLAQKGANTKERPHRFSKITVVPEDLKTLTLEDIEKVIGEQKEEPQTKSRPQVTTQQFDLLDFMREHNITYREGTATDSVMYMLDECPFDHSHRNGDAKIFHYTNGAISFKCHHNSCAGKKWEDVRRLFDPTAYERQYDTHIEDGYKKYKEEKKKEEPKQTKKYKPMNLSDMRATTLIEKKLDPLKVFVGVGSELPLLVEGTCIVSAKAKAGKSWFLQDMLIAVANGDDFLGFKTRQSSVLHMNFESGDVLEQARFKKSIELAGRTIPDCYYRMNEVPARIGDGFVELLESFMEQDKNLGVIVIDVFQMVRSARTNQKESDYEYAYRDIAPLNEFCKNITQA